jgi:hypothetical protein
VESSFLQCLFHKDVLVDLMLPNFCEMEFIFLWIFSVIFALMLPNFCEMEFIFLWIFSVIFASMHSFMCVI